MLEQYQKVNYVWKLSKGKHLEITLHTKADLQSINNYAIILILLRAVNSTFSHGTPHFCMFLCNLNLCKK